GDEHTRRPPTALIHALQRAQQRVRGGAVVARLQLQSDRGRGDMSHTRTTEAAAETDDARASLQLTHQRSKRITECEPRPLLRAAQIERGLPSAESWQVAVAPGRAALEFAS